MKKYIFKTLIPCLMLVLGVTGCYDEMDSKESVDAQFALSTIPTVSVASAVANDFSSASVSGTVSGTEGVVEVGFMTSLSADFTAAATTKAEEIGASFTAVLSNLSEMTTYNVKAYAYLADGRMVFSEVQTFTTPSSPTFELDGTYSATEYDAQTGEVNGNYEVTVSFVEGSTTEVLLHNFWDGGETVNGVYDPETGVVTIPTNQLIYVHPSYGDVVMKAVNDAISAHTAAVTCQFTAKGGFLNTSTWGAVCSAGTFGFCYVQMAHK